ncbi:MAG: ATP-dependent helicase, partial [Candidatus Hydrogenedentota bacterium]
YRDRVKDGGHRLDDIARDLVRDIGYRDELTRTSKSPEQEAFRWENVEAVLRSINKYEETAPKASLRDFLDESALNQAPGRDSKERSGQNEVTLTTIHGAKGLEYSFVFIVGAEEGMIPHHKSVTPAELEEERRLFYVALTRAKRHLTIFEALSRHRHGKDRVSTTSRFLHEIPAELLRKRPYAHRETPDPPPPSPNQAAKRPRKGRAPVVR